jgi:hypothetical protein
MILIPLIQLARHSRMLVFKDDMEQRLRARFLNTTEPMADEEREQVPSTSVRTESALEIEEEA